MSKGHGVESSLEVGAMEEPLDVLYCSQFLFDPFARCAKSHAMEGRI